MKWVKGVYVWYILLVYIIVGSYFLSYPFQGREQFLFLLVVLMGLIVPHVYNYGRRYYISRVVYYRLVADMEQLRKENEVLRGDLVRVSNELQGVRTSIEVSQQTSAPYVSAFNRLQGKKHGG